jgi:ParB-like chromosome segregation protein Spo0J
MTEKEPVKPRINKEYSQLLRPLPKKEYKELKRSIKDHGQQEEIVINEAGEIIDGYHRYRCCLELGATPNYGVIYEFSARAKRLEICYGRRGPAGCT